MRSRGIAISCVAAALAFGRGGAEAAEGFGEESRICQARRVDSPPVIDGKLDDATWRSAEKMSEFRLAGGAALAKARTDAYACWDTDNLYVGFVCHEPEMGKTIEHYREPRDQAHWGGGADEIELFLAPFHGQKGYIQITVSMAGEWYDKFNYGTGSDDNWTCEPVVKTSRSPDQWTVEMAIPFSKLLYPREGYNCGMTPEDGTAWEATFCRYSIPLEEWSSWNAGSFHRRKPMGRLVFVDTNARIRSTVDAGWETAVGAKSFRTALTNRSDKELSCQLSLKVGGGGPLEAKTALPPGTAKPLSIQYMARGNNDGRLEFRLIDSGNVFRKGSVVYDISDSRPSVAALLKDARAYREKCKNLPTLLCLAPLNYEKALNDTEVKTDALLKEWDDAFARSDAVSVEAWKALNDRAALLLKDLRPLLDRGMMRAEMAAVAAKADTPVPEYGVGLADNMSKIRPDSLFSGQIGDTMRLCLARNECEGGQIVIYPFAKALEKVVVSVTALKADDGSLIPEQQIRIRPVGFVPVAPIPGIAGLSEKAGGLWPDPLLEVKDFTCAADRLQPVWIDVRTTTETKAGTYRGKIRVAPGNSHPLELVLEVKVWNFTLPAKNSLRVDYWFYGGPIDIVPYYKIQFDSKEFDKYATFMASYGFPLYMAPPDPFRTYAEAEGKYTFDFSSLDEYLKIAFAHGLNVFNLNLTCNESRETWFPVKKDWSYLDRSTGERRAKKLTEEEADALYFQVLKDMAEHLRAQDWFDSKTMIFYAFDELQPRGERYERMKKVHTKVKEILPGVPRAFAMNTLDVKAFDGYVDIWIPVIERISPQTIKELQGKGQEVWWYTMGYAKWPDYFINQDCVAHRVIPWLNWKFGVTGVLRYAINRWGINRTPPFVKALITDDPGKRWPNSPWEPNDVMAGSGSGATYLFYPGPDGKPWASIRLENARDGFEDYEYFKLLSGIVDKAVAAGKIPTEKLAEARRLLTIPDALVKSQSDYAVDPSAYQERRQALGILLESLGTLLGKPPGE